jgi:hypothetical protein
MHFFDRMCTKYEVTAVGDKIKGKPGDIIEVVQGESPYPHQNKYRKTTITVIGPDRQGKGFYYFYGKGKPSAGNQRPNHSNMFVWGVDSWKKIGKVKFVTKIYKNHQWTLTGIKNIDTQMANLDDRYQIFSQNAPAKLKSLYAENEDQNFHAENAAMVDDFCNWLADGKKAADFKVEAEVKGTFLQFLCDKYNTK